MGSGGMGGGGGKTVINVEGNLDRENLPDVEDAIRSEAEINESRNDG